MGITMRIESKQVIDIVSTLAVVASLIFVGYQLILERRIAEAAQQHNRMELQYDLNRVFLDNDSLVDTLVLNWSSQKPSWWGPATDSLLDSGISMESIARMNRWYMMLLFTHNNNFYQFRRGLLDESGWQSAVNVIQLSMRTPYVAEWWLGETSILPEFREYLVATQTELVD
mgnify:CR=1 FL=1|tara:strand:- start:130 stop:645 length:516 start_codon:yes stop_codon:yes gene_type:complete